MALLKKIDSGSGYSIEYWRIHKMEILVGGNVSVTFVGYIDAEARKNNLKPVQGIPLIIPASDIDLNGNIRQQVYDWAISQQDDSTNPGKSPVFGGLNKNNFFAKAKKDKGQK